MKTDRAIGDLIAAMAGPSGYGEKQSLWVGRVTLAYDELRRVLTDRGSPPRVVMRASMRLAATAVRIALDCGYYPEDREPGAETLFDVPVEGGKYRFVQRINGADRGLFITRHGQPWLTIERGAKAIIALMGELEQARREIEAITGQSCSTVTMYKCGECEAPLPNEPTDSQLINDRCESCSALDPEAVPR